MRNKGISIQIDTQELNVPSPEPTPTKRVYVTDWAESEMYKNSQQLAEVRKELQELSRTKAVHKSSDYNEMKKIIEKEHSLEKLKEQLELDNLK